MENKISRLSIISQIIENNKISSQEQLLEILNSKNIVTTQATLSRDLKFLKNMIITLRSNKIGH